MTSLIDRPFVFLFIGVIALIAEPIAIVPLAALAVVVGKRVRRQTPIK